MIALLQILAVWLVAAIALGLILGPILRKLD